MQLELEPGTGLVSDFLMNIEKLTHYFSIKVVPRKLKRLARVVWLETDLFFSSQKKNCITAEKWPGCQTHVSGERLAT